MKYLIVTADDLGLTESINDGIAKACREGVVTAVSVIPTGEAFADALKVVKDLGLKEIGAHLSLTETKPLLSSSKFYKTHNDLFKDVLLRKASYDAIRSELKAQLELLQGFGVKISHINGHEHIHIMPEILDVFISLAKEFKVPALRYPRGDRPMRPFSLRDLYKKAVLSFFSINTEKMFRESGVFYTDHFIGLLDAGMLKEGLLIKMLGGLKDGVTELVCHPGFLSPKVMNSYRWHINAEEELSVITGHRIKNFIRNNGIKLITYGELPSIRG